MRGPPDEGGAAPASGGTVASSVGPAPANQAASGAAATGAGTFVTGSLLRHIVVMTSTGAVGLFALFIVDLLNIVYVGMLGDPSATAAVGFASTAFFFLVSISIGISISGAALVSRALGRGDRAAARRIAASFLIHAAAALTLSSLVLGLFSRDLLALLGAEGATLDAAHRFLLIQIPTVPLLALGMGFASVLRACGDARRSMMVTLWGGIATAFLDPLLIFGFGLGIDGAAFASNLARAALAWVGFQGASIVRGLVGRPSLSCVLGDSGPIWAIAAPAVLTNVATPVANGYVTAAVAPFGDQAVAALAMISRLIPVAFGAVFALSGAVGPILGQNLGAGRLDRVRRGFTDSLFVVAAYVLAVWALLVLLETPILALLGAEGVGADLVSYFIRLIAWSWLFHGVLFAANAAFNTLGYPALSTGFNWSKATLGTIPFVAAGASWGGAEGALLGQAIGAVLFGIAGIAAGYWVIARLERRRAAGLAERAQQA